MEEKEEEEGGEGMRRGHGGANVAKEGCTVAAECMAYGNSLTVECVVLL